VRGRGGRGGVWQRDSCEGRSCRPAPPSSNSTTGAHTLPLPLSIPPPLALASAPALLRPSAAGLSGTEAGRARGTPLASESLPGSASDGLQQSASAAMGEPQSLSMPLSRSSSLPMRPPPPGRSHSADPLGVLSPPPCALRYESFIHCAALALALPLPLHLRPFLSPGIGARGKEGGQRVVFPLQSPVLVLGTAALPCRAAQSQHSSLQERRVPGELSRRGGKAPAGTQLSVLRGVGSSEVASVGALCGCSQYPWPRGGAREGSREVLRQKAEKGVQRVEGVGVRDIERVSEGGGEGSRSLFGGLGRVGAAVAVAWWSVDSR